MLIDQMGAVIVPGDVLEDVVPVLGRSSVNRWVQSLYPAMSDVHDLTLLVIFTMPLYLFLSTVKKLREQFGPVVVSDYV